MSSQKYIGWVCLFKLDTLLAEAGLLQSAVLLGNGMLLYNTGMVSESEICQGITLGYMTGRGLICHCISQECSVVGDGSGMVNQWANMLRELYIIELYIIMRNLDHHCMILEQSVGGDNPLLL